MYIFSPSTDTALLESIMKTCLCSPLLLYGKTGVYRGIHFFLIFALKHRLWVLIEAVLTCTHNLCFEQRYEKSKTFQPKIVIFTDVKNRCMLHGRVFVMSGREMTKS